MTWFTKGLRQWRRVLFKVSWTTYRMTWFTKGLRRIYSKLIIDLARLYRMTWFTKGLRLFSLSLLNSRILRTEWPDLRRDYDPARTQCIEFALANVPNDLIYEWITTNSVSRFFHIVVRVPNDLIYEGITTCPGNFGSSVSRNLYRMTWFTKGLRLLFLT